MRHPRQAARCAGVCARPPPRPPPDDRLWPLGDALARPVDATPPERLAPPRAHRALVRARTHDARHAHPAPRGAAASGRRATCAQGDGAAAPPVARGLLVGAHSVRAAHDGRDAPFAPGTAALLALAIEAHRRLSYVQATKTLFRRRRNAGLAVARPVEGVARFEGVAARAPGRAVGAAARLRSGRGTRPSSASAAARG